MKYQKLYQKYKAKYLELKMQQTGGDVNLLDALDLSPANKTQKDFTKTNIESLHDSLLDSPPKITKDDVNKMPSFIKPSSPVPSAPISPIPSAPASKSTTKQTTKSSGPTYNFMYPLHVSSHTLRPGDRVMKTSYTSDPLGGVIGDRGTITSIDFLNDLVAVQFDRLYSQGIISYVSPSILTQVYDPMPRLHQKKPKVKVVIDDDDDDDLFDDDYDVEYKVKSKKSSKKRSKKSSKKSKKSSKKSKKSKSSKKSKRSKK